MQQALGVVRASGLSAVLPDGSRRSGIGRRARLNFSARSTLRVRAAGGGAVSDVEKSSAGVAASRYGVRLVGTGSAVPAGILTNKDLMALVDTDDEWIRTRTGISQRHILGKGESLTMLGADAATKALEMAGVAAEDVDLVLLATSTPDDIFGSACTIQAAIGAKNAAAFDCTAACSGFVVGMVNAVHLMRGGNFKNVLVIGGDCLSRYVDWRDRSTCILFGDGCGAVVLTAVEGECNMLGFDVRSDGNLNKNLIAQQVDSSEEGAVNKPTSAAACSSNGSFNNISMTGSEIFKFAVRAVPQIVGSALKHAGLTVEHIDWLVLHQANQRIIDSAADRLGVPAENVVSNIAEYGNTSAASIPLALDEWVRADKVKDGDIVRPLA